MDSHSTSVRAEASGYADAEEAIREADLVINATSVGMRPGDPCPIPAQWLSSAQVVFDMVYGTPERTALVTCGEAVGAKTLDGLGHAGLPGRDGRRHLEQRLASAHAARRHAGRCSPRDRQTRCRGGARAR